MTEPGPGSPAASHRIKSYKNYNRNDASESRRRREEEGIQLRKQKREQQVRLQKFYFLAIYKD